MTKRNKRVPSPATPTAIASRAVTGSLSTAVDQFASTTDVPVPANTWWDDLRVMYHDLAQLIVVSTSPAAAVKNTQLMAFVRDFGTLYNNVQILLGDLTKMSSTLSSIHAKHSGRTGSASTHDEFRQAMQIFEEYTSLAQEHSGVVHPTLQHILEQIHTAEQALHAANQQLQAGVVESVQTEIQEGTGVNLKEVVSAFNDDFAAKAAAEEGKTVEEETSATTH